MNTMFDFSLQFYRLDNRVFIFSFEKLCALGINLYFCNRSSQPLVAGRVETSMESGGWIKSIRKDQPKGKDVFGRYYLYYLTSQLRTTYRGNATEASA